MRLLSNDSDEFPTFVIRQLRIVQDPSRAFNARQWRTELANQSSNNAVQRRRFVGFVIS